MANYFIGLVRFLILQLSFYISLLMTISFHGNDTIESFHFPFSRSSSVTKKRNKEIATNQILLLKQFLLAFPKRNHLNFYNAIYQIGLRNNFLRKLKGQLVFPFAISFVLTQLETNSLFWFSLQHAFFNKNAFQLDSIKSTFFFLSCLRQESVDSFAAEFGLDYFAQYMYKCYIYTIFVHSQIEFTAYFCS